MFATTSDFTPNITVNLGDVQQTIDGFGAADAFQDTAITDAGITLLFDQTNGIGLSFLRCQMDSDGTYHNAQYTDATRAVAKGARIWVAPWTPPAAWKDNGSESNGGHLFVANYGDWADRLCAFQALLLANAGVGLYGISVHNEPDFAAPYVSCQYTTAEMVAFIKVLGPKIAALSPRPVLISPETAGWNSDLWSYGDAITADATALSYTDIYATHMYDTENPTLHAIPAGKKLWQTEVSSFDAATSDITNGIRVALWIHRAMVINASAWHYWLAVGEDHAADNEGLLTDLYATPKRFFTVGNYSKFIRPGYVRVGTSGTVTNLSLTAYTNQSTGATAIVAINDGAAQQVKVGLTGRRFTSFTPSLTSASSDLATQATVYPSQNVLTLNLPASCVMTFSGTGV